MPAASTIRDALAAAIKTIKVANGYQQDIPDANVFGAATPMQHMQQANAGTSYPRVFVYSDGADYEGLPANRIIKHEIFSVIAVFAKPASSVNTVPTLEMMVERFIDDFELMVNRNKQLGGSDLVTLRAQADDLGASVTEAVAIFELEIVYKRSFN